MVKVYAQAKKGFEARRGPCEDPLIENGYAIGAYAPGWVSYVVSAPLSNKGSPFFWNGTNWLGYIAALVDVFYHVLIWLAILIMDCWVAHLPNRDEDSHSIGDAYAQELQWGATVCTILVWTGLVISIVFGFMGQIPGSAWPSTVSLLRGGAIGGIIFSALYALKLMAMVGGGANDVHNNWNIVTAEPEITVRQLTLWSIGLKCLAFATLDANLNYWGAVTQRELANICNFTAKNFGNKTAWADGDARLNTGIVAGLEVGLPIPGSVVESERRE